MKKSNWLVPTIVFLFGNFLMTTLIFTILANDWGFLWIIPIYVGMAIYGWFTEDIARLVMRQRD